MKKIGILGCGWLGLPLAKFLVENQYHVNGSTTQQSKFEIIALFGIKPYLIALNPEFSGDKMFFDVDTLVINIPPKAKTKGQDYHLDQINALIIILKDTTLLKNILFVSSTSVYNNNNRTVFEHEGDPDNFLIKAEKLLKEFANTRQINITIARMGGLMGDERNPCKYLIDKNDIPNTPVNYIHRIDAIGCIAEIIKKNLWNETFNIVCPTHPTRFEIINKCLKNISLDNIVFEASNIENSYKIVSSQKFIEKTNYQFHFSDPLIFSYL